MESLNPVGMYRVPKLGTLPGDEAHDEQVGAGGAVGQQGSAFGEKGLQHFAISAGEFARRALG